MNCSRRCRQTQFSFTVGFGDEMKLKSRLPPFSLIWIRCPFAFCYRYRSLLPLSKFWYKLTVRLGVQVRSKFCVRDRFLYRLTGNYYWWVWQDTRFLANLIRRPILFPDRGSLRFGFKLIIIVLRKRAHAQTHTHTHTHTPVSYTHLTLPTSVYV